MANHGPAYGMSREIQMKNQARFVLEEAQETLEWIQTCTDTPFDISPMKMDEGLISNALKNGVQLCHLINVLAAPSEAIAYNKNPKMPFHMMENISNFLTAIKKYGVPEISCFQTVDLYEWKQPFKVIECLRALAAVAQKNNAPVPVPHWVVKISKEAPRRFSAEVLNQGQTVVGLQMGSNKGASQHGMTPYGLSRQIIDSHQTK